MEESGMAIAEFPPCEEFAVSIIKLALTNLGGQISHRSLAISSPFARTNEGGVADESQVGGANSGNHDDERASGGIKGQMNILDQVLHADCKPLLEFCLHLKRLMLNVSCRNQARAEIQGSHRLVGACCYCPKKKKCSIQDKPS
ncbi:hypothetical protein GBAR_LOCUS8815 [Geodia barretti]|uniref:Uncharacterized protein n=1 Tax=Geodia barretti TaxID=519541 RepID=A0AA35RPL9_GEOBA|nr:hypothetical protein GBAR_LOCUS8815 [Geodia barretti]